MIACFRFVTLSAIAVMTCGLVDAVSAQEASTVERKVLAPIDRDKLLSEEQERHWRAEEPVPLQFAVSEEVSFNPANSGAWEEVENGRIWRLSIFAPEAVSLSLGITRIDLPEGATLTILDRQRTQQQGPYTSKDISAKGRLWTAVVESDEIVIELFVPRGASDPTLEITQVNKGFQSFGPGSADKSGSANKSGSCNNNVVCPEGDPWRNQIRSVARYTIDGTFLCTGQLVNNTSVDFTPYFLSANHCDVTVNNDDTLVFYWNFESPNCGDVGGGSLANNQTGAIFRASNAPSDFLLVELAQPPNSSFNVFFTGWDRSGVAPNSTATIHHPDGDEKAISLNTNPVTSTAYQLPFVDPAAHHWRVDDWEDGTTEHGSSGACLWDAATGLCVGQLHGGFASCTNTNASDWYGKFSSSWTGGGTNATRLSNWLDPGSTGVLSLNGDPHIATLDGTYYDFQGAGEYVALKDTNGAEIQVRQSPIATTFTPGPNPYHGLATCVSLNSAVAARVGDMRVTYQPRLDGEPDPQGLELRIDSKLVKLDGNGIDLGDGGQIFPTDDKGGIRVEFPEKYSLLVTPGWWASQQAWYLNVSVVRRPVSSVAGAGADASVLGVGGLAAPIARTSWLPPLPDGSTVGPMPASLSDRYDVLYEKFGNSWRVTDKTSLFDYASSGQSTQTFTLKTWPSGAAGCSLLDTQPVKGLEQPDVAKKACEGLRDFGTFQDCVFDVTVTGDTGFAETYLRDRRILREVACGRPDDGILPSWCGANIGKSEAERPDRLR